MMSCGVASPLGDLDRDLAHMFLSSLHTSAISMQEATFEERQCSKLR